MGSLLNFIGTHASQILALGDFISNFSDELIPMIIEGVIHSNAITKVLAGTLYAFIWGIDALFFMVLDIFQAIFSVFSGNVINETSISGIESDIVLYLINSDIVQQIFFSILILSLFLLVIFTIMAIVKNQYSEKQEPVSKIISGSFKALLLYLLVPITTIVCLMVADIVLTAVNGATKQNQNQALSGMVFATAANNANKLRNADLLSSRLILGGMFSSPGTYFYLNQFEDELEELGVTNAIEAGEASPEAIAKIADLIDNNFSVNMFDGSTWISFDVTLLTGFYDVMEINHLAIWIGGGFMIWAIGKVIWGLIGRMFKMTIHFAISPAVMATLPLDNGNAFTSWRKEMFKNGSMIIVAVGIMNILYAILPFINSLNIFDGLAAPILDGLTHMLITIVALHSAKDLISTVSNWFGTGNLFTEADATKKIFKDQKKKIGDTLKKTTDKATGMFGGLAGGWKEAKDQKGNKFIGAMQGLAKGAGWTKDLEAHQKTFKEGMSGAKSYYKDIHTKDPITGNKLEGDAPDIYAGREVVNQEAKKAQVLLDKYNSATDDVAKRMVINKAKSLALVGERINKIDEEIQVQEQKKSQESAVVNPISQLLEGADKVMTIAEQIVGRKVTSVELDALKKGNLTTLTAGLSADNVQKIKDMYSLNAANLNEAVREYSKLQERVADLSVNDARTKKLFDDNVDLKLFSSMKLEAGTDGYEKFKAAVQHQEQEVQNIENKINTLQNSIETIASQALKDAASKSNIEDKEYIAIGKKAGK